MKVKLDENIPASLAAVFEQFGHDVSTVTTQGLSGQSDAAVWEAVQRGSRLSVTMDLDFADIGRHPPGTHQGILILRPSRQGRKSTRAVIEAVLVQQPLESLRGAIAVGDELRIRVRRK